MQILISFLIIWITVVGGCAIILWLITNPNAGKKLIRLWENIRGITNCIAEFLLRVIVDVFRWIKQAIAWVVIRFFMWLFEIDEEGYDDTEGFYHN